MRFVVKSAAFKTRNIAGKEVQMAKCAHCGKTTTFGHNVSFSNRKTNRVYKPNLQKVTVIENGRKIQKTLCAKCIRTMAKTV